MATRRSISAAENSRGSIVRTFRAPASFSRARIGTARIDSYWSSGRFGKALNRGSRWAFAGLHPGRSSHLLDARPVRRAQDELVGLVVVEVDETGVGFERLGHLARDEPEHLLEVERRVDGRDRLGQNTQVSSRGVHPPILGTARGSVIRTHGGGIARDAVGGHAGSAGVAVSFSRASVGNDRSIHSDHNVDRYRRERQIRRRNLETMVSDRADPRPQTMINKTLTPALIFRHTTGVGSGS